MTRYLARRLGLMLVTLWVMSVAIFFISQIAPGDLARTILGQFASPDSLAALRGQLHLNDPAPERYLRWISGFPRGDWGLSPTNANEPIRDLIPARLTNSLILAGAALLVIVPVSVLLGLAAALRRDRFSDHLITIGALALMAVPEFITGTLLLYVFGVWSHWLPTDSIASLGVNPLSTPVHLILPAMSLGLVYFGYVSRMMRSSTIAVLDSAYVRTAVLKGLPRHRVLTHHVLRNAMAPTVTVIAAQAGYLIGGLVVVETLFDYPGIGTLMLNASQNHDLPLLEDCVLVTAALFMLSNLLSDVLNAMLNPHIRLGLA
jgi:peptide/nickel transport system permease protein